jgi:hypothetical protein
MRGSGRKSGWMVALVALHMAHPVVTATEEQAAAAIAGLDPDKEPYVLVFLLRPSADAGPAGEGDAPCCSGCSGSQTF